MNKPIRCSTHFHACDCREYEFEQLKKENQEKDRIILSQEKERQKTEAFWKEKLCEIQDEKDAENEELKKKFKNEEGCWLISMESRDEKITDLQKENQETREALKWALHAVRFYIKEWSMESNLVSVREKDARKVEETLLKFNISETLNSSKEGV